MSGTPIVSRYLWSDEAKSDGGVLAGILGRAIHDIEADEAAVAVHREKRCGACGADTRECASAFEQLVKKLEALLGLRIFGLRKRNISGEEMIRLEAGRDRLHALKTPQQQTRADEQQHRERDFGDDKNRAKAVARGARLSSRGWIH